MAKKKGFRDWYESSDTQTEDFKFKRKDNKRYDSKKSAIQKARRQKAKQKNSYFS
jgi:hypothetical protein